MTTEAASSLEVVRPEVEVPEGEGDDMAEEHDDSEEDDAIQKVCDKALKLVEDGPSAPSNSRSSSLTALLGQTFNVAVTTVEPKSAQTRAEEEDRMYLEVPSLPLTDDPLEWWSTNDNVYPLLAKLAK